MCLDFGHFVPPPPMAQPVSDPYSQPPPVRYVVPPSAAAAQPPTQQIPPPPHPPSRQVAELMEHLRSLHLQAESGQAAPVPSHPVRTPEYVAPYSPPRPVSSRLLQSPLRSHADLRTWSQGLNSPPPVPHRSGQPRSPPRQETSYRGPKPQIPLFTDDDPRQFARLQLALDNLLPA